MAMKQLTYNGRSRDGVTVDGVFFAYGVETDVSADLAKTLDGHPEFVALPKTKKKETA